MASSGWLLFAALLALGECGHVHPGLGGLLATLCAIAYLATLRPRDAQPSTARLAQAAGLLAGAALLARTGEPGVLAAMALLPAAALRLDDRAAAARSQLFALAAFALFMPLMRHGGLLWRMLEQVSFGYSRSAGRLIGEPYLMSATAIALPGLVLAALFVLARALLAPTRAWGWAVRSLGMLLAGHLLALLSLELIAFVVQRWAVFLEFFLFNPQSVVAAFLVMALAVAERGAPAPTLADATPRLVPALTAFIGALGFAFALAWSPPGAPGGSRVLLYDRGFLDWRMPTFGQYGQRSGGMFGLLPRLLNASGWQPTISSDSLIESHLAPFRCVVLINVNESFSLREIEDIRRFVAGGGSLLVLGDHTGVAGIRGPYNELLKPFGIRYQFDCASFPGNSWEYAWAPVPHPLRAGLAHDDEPQVWVGASLALDSPARPVLLARYGFSDWGDPAQYEQSYLGDRKFNPGEQLGDLVLAAECNYGRGRVLVFGDTSPFQSGALVKSQRFVQRVFRYLLAKPGRWPFPLSLLFSLLGLVLVGVALGPPGSRSWAALLAVPLGAALGGALASLPHARATLPWPQTNVALIDHSHVERFDTLAWYDDCIGGLEYNLMRNDFLPRWVEHGLARELEHAKLLIVIAPARRFSAGEVAAVERFVGRGGWVVVTVGWEEREGARNVLDALGFDVAPNPLTHFEAVVAGQRVRFNNGWPVVATRAGAEVVVREFDRPVVQLRRTGRGGVIMIGDSSFLLDRNLEGEAGAFEGNIVFFRELLARMRGGGRP